MFLSSSLSGALDRIAERAADVRRAYTPGAIAQHDDVATPSLSPDFTLDPLSASAPEGAYFVTSDVRGHQGYTRDGSFALRDGVLTSAAGRPVLGMLAGGGALAPLRIDAVDNALARVSAPSIERDGSFAYYRETIDPRTATRDLHRVVVGRIALARFPAGTRLTASDANSGAAPPGIAPQIGLPSDGVVGPLTPMRRERSGIDIDESLARLKDAYLAFEALAAAEAAKSHLAKAATDLLK